MGTRNQGDQGAAYRGGALFNANPAAYPLQPGDIAQEWEVRLIGSMQDNKTSMIKDIELYLNLAVLTKEA